MDYRALEFGLRNKQLLQIDCFLKIQIETFKIQLQEKLDRMRTDRSITELIDVLERFFFQEWKNIFNKIVSVAMIQMSGDYQSKIFTILLFRLILFACNQFILIISSLPIANESGHQNLSSRVLTNNANDSSEHIESQKLISIKDKIFSKLIENICLIRDNIDLINETIDISLKPSRLVMDEDDDSLCSLVIENSDKKSMFSLKSDKVQEFFEKNLQQNSLPLFSFAIKQRTPDDHHLQDQLNWNIITERIVSYCFNHIIRDLPGEIDLELMQKINFYLNQTGHCSFHLLYSFFLQTTDCSIRRKLINFFALCLDQSSSESFQKFSLKNDSFLHLKSKFTYYLHLVSIIDLFIFTQKPLIGTDEKLAIAIEWLEQIDSKSITQSLILPILDEIEIHPNSFNNWLDMIADYFNKTIFDPYREKIFIEKNFNDYLDAETLWKYLIDNNRSEILIDWIKNNTIEMPYCDKIKPNSFVICKSMLNYLLCESSLVLKYRVFTTLINNPYFFNQFEFTDLIDQIVSFDEFLKLCNRSEDIKQQESMIFLEKLLNKSIKLENLLKYCIQNELFDFLLLLFNRYRIDFEGFLKSLQTSRLVDEKIDPLMLKLLNFLNDLFSFQHSDSNESVFKQSLFIYRHLNESKIGINFCGKDFYDDVHFILQTLKIDIDDLDLIFFMFTFSEIENFDRFFDAIKSLDSNGHSNLVEIFLNNLYSKYPLIYQASRSVNRIKYDSSCDELIRKLFETSAFDEDEQLSIRNNPQSLECDLYSILHQSIPFLNIEKIFRWQINSPPKHSKQEKKTNQIGLYELPHFSQKHSTEVYGLKSDLTFSYYLKNSRLIEAFLSIMSKNVDANNQDHNQQQLKIKNRKRKFQINERFATKSIKKASLIGYTNIENDSIVTACLLFQSLIRSSLERDSKFKIDSLRKSIDQECQKFRLHSALGRIIIRYGTNFLNCDTETQDRNSSILASILRRSHFLSDRTSSYKLLELASLSIGRKYCGSDRRGSRKEFQQDFKLHSLVLENSLNKNFHTIDSLLDFPLLIECFEWKPLFAFADFYSMKKPFDFLFKCSKEENWLAVVLFAQIYSITKEEMQIFLNEAGFNNVCIGEHLSKAFESSRWSTATSLTATDSKILRTKQTSSASRNILYSKLFKDRSPNSKSIRSEKNPHQSRALLIKDDLQSLSTDTTENVSIMSSSIISSEENFINNHNVINEQRLCPANVSEDFLHLIMDIYHDCVCYSNRIGLSSYSLENYFETSLLFVSVSLSNPILTLLACSLERKHSQEIEIRSYSPSSISPILVESHDSGQVFEQSSSVKDGCSNHNFNHLKFVSFACWLLASVDHQSKQSYIDWYCEANGQTVNDSLVDCFTNWPSDRVLRLIDILTSIDSKNYQKILLGFQLFQLNLPIISILLNFLIEFLVMKDYYLNSDLLQKFQSQLLEYKEEELLMSSGVLLAEEPRDIRALGRNYEWQASSFYTRCWIERCSLIIITNSMLIAKQFELGILLSHYNFVRIQDSFSSSIHRVPDMRKFYLFSQCLNNVPDFVLPIADLLQIEPNDEPETKYGEVLRPLIFDLQESGHFDEARNIVNFLTSSDVNEFIINEWMLKAKKADLNKNPNSVKIDISFWENCWSQVITIDPSMLSAYKVMERFVEQLEPTQMLIKSFVLLKCLLAIETILRNRLETHHETFTSQNLHDDSSSLADVSINTNSCSNLDFIEDYFKYEKLLWKSIVECEHYLHTTILSTQTDQQSIDHQELILAWQEVWKQIISYFNSSSMIKIIIPGIEEKFISFVLPSIENHLKTRINIDKIKQTSLNQVIGKLLDHFCFAKAHQVAEMFGYYHEDFVLIETCDRLAKGLLKDLGDSPSLIQLKLGNNNESNQSKKNLLLSNLNEEQKKIVSMLSTVANLAGIGRKFCQLISLHYRIACCFSMSYQEFLSKEFNACELLEKLFASNQIEIQQASSDLDEQSDFDEINPYPINSIYAGLIERYSETISLAKEFIKMISNVDEKLDTEEKIVDLIAKFVYQHTQKLVDLQFRSSIAMNYPSFDDFIERIKTDALISGNPKVMQNLFTEIELDRNQLEFNSARFSVLIQLLPHSNLLGHRLLELAKKSKMTFESSDISLQDESISIEQLNTETELHLMIAKRKLYAHIAELYIRAHECFTAQCDVGGIALVLRKTRLFIMKKLHPARYFHLILRLLTGIGRYSEMTFCFDLFRECDRFEMILSKRVHRVIALKPF
ncbi:Spatacsin [Sarcoptes scabiei]|uniref:Spatacsin n=1 Tax=Sarcoptes scabiei TaxID=52283 RepID=A0A834RFW3_SARSC|nr:Spatacsin [Sarcoptes scabiei]